jgi:hypothetical protein
MIVCDGPRLFSVFVGICFTADVNHGSLSLRVSDYVTHYCRLKCKMFPLRYIGQTGRTFHIRYKEHIRATRRNEDTPEYAKHVLNNKHSYGTTRYPVRLGSPKNAQHHMYVSNRSHTHRNTAVNERKQQTNLVIFTWIQYYYGCHQHMTWHTERRIQIKSLKRPPQHVLGGILFWS